MGVVIMSPVIMSPVIMSPVISLSMLLSLTVLTSAQDCSGFHDAMCPLDDENILAFDNDIYDIALCQRMCAQNNLCHFFTHFENQCFQLRTCEFMAKCENCVSGPPSPPIISTCPWPPSPTTTTTTTTTTRGTRGTCD